MQSRKLHIICHDVPFPPDFGGVLDQFYKIKALHENGIEIYLHCFTSGRAEREELNRYCKKVNYYTRKTGHKSLSYELPYIVCSRSSPELLDRLLEDDYPILLEGVHCSYLTNDKRFQNRKIILRLHNIESVYYKQLAHCCHSWLKKIYYFRESAILKKYEKKIASHWSLLTFTQSDADLAATNYRSKKISVIPVFLPYTEIDSPMGIGCYCLYHGNLSVEENEKAVIWLLENVFSDLKIPFVIAGKSAGPRIFKAASKVNTCTIVSDPSDNELRDIISKAQVHVIPSFNCTGIKMKLLNALFNGRHCLVNIEAVQGSGLEEFCYVANDPYEFQDKIKSLYQRPFTFLDLEHRKEKLLTSYNNQQTANLLISQIW